MENIAVSQADDGWVVSIEGGARFMYVRLTDAIRRAGSELGTPPGGSPTVQWNFTDDFMQEARAFALERSAHAIETQRLSRRTDDMIVSLAKEGLSNGDIAAVLGLTPARVSQIIQDTAEWLWGQDDPSGEVQLAKIRFGRGWVAVQGRGPLPETLKYGGEIFHRTGGASMANGQPWRHTYVGKDAVW